MKWWTELMGPDAMILVFWMLSSKPTFSLSTFTFIKKLFSSSSLSAKGFSIVNKTDVFLELPCFLYDLTNVGNLISSSSASWKLSLSIWKFSVHILLKPVCCPKLLQWSLNFCDPMNWDLLSSSVHGISQARILEWRWGDVNTPAPSIIYRDNSKVWPHCLQRCPCRIKWRSLPSLHDK